VNPLSWEESGIKGVRLTSTMNWQLINTGQWKKQAINDSKEITTYLIYRVTTP
jgi:hypothetical protein